MDESQVERLLQQYAAHVPAERLFAQERADYIWAEIFATSAPVGGADEQAAVRTATPRPRLSSRLARVISRRRLVFGAAAVLALAAVITGVLGWSSRGPRLEVDGAYAKSELFRVTRAAGEPQSAPGNSFYIGVRVDRPAYVRILTVDDQLRLEPLALDRAGSHELHMRAKSELALGGYVLASTGPTGVSSRITHFLILATPHPIDEAALARWLDAANRAIAAATRVDLPQWTRDLRRSFGGTVSVVTP